MKKIISMLCLISLHCSLIYSADRGSIHTTFDAEPLQHFDDLEAQNQPYEAIQAKRSFKQPQWEGDAYYQKPLSEYQPQWSRSSDELSHEVQANLYEPSPHSKSIFHKWWEQLRGTTSPEELDLDAHVTPPAHLKPSDKAATGDEDYHNEPIEISQD